MISSLYATMCIFISTDFLFSARIKLISTENFDWNQTIVIS